jgi:hypothetical protein
MKVVEILSHTPFVHCVESVQVGAFPSLEAVVGMQEMKERHLVLHCLSVSCTFVGLAPQVGKSHLQQSELSK